MRHYFECVWVILGGRDIFLGGWGVRRGVWVLFWLSRDKWG